MVKQKRKEKVGKWDVPIPKVKPIPEDEIFKVIRSGKRQSMNSTRYSIVIIAQRSNGNVWLPKFALLVKRSHEKIPSMNASFALAVCDLRR